MTNSLPFSENKKLKVIQFFGGPSIGKSTVAPKLYALMKEKGLKVEFAHEIAKDLIWESAHHMFYEQDWIFAAQHRLIRRLTRHDREYVVTDSSILLGIFYMDPAYPQSLKPLIREVFDSYNNINIMLERNPNIPYEVEGRNQNYDEAVELDKRIRQYFIDENIPFYQVMTGSDAAQTILDEIILKDPVDDPEKY